MGQLTVEIYGDFRVLEDGVPLDLPPSKKARALLAYLILTQRPQRREHLCELFWDTPHDPKGSLRWALSKLKTAFSPENRGRFSADRERIFFDLSGVTLSSQRIASLIDTDPPDKDALFAARDILDRTCLAGLDLSRMDQFGFWLTEQRENAARLKASVIQACLSCDDLSPAEELQLAQDGLDCQPFDPLMANQLLSILKRQNLLSEAEALKTELMGRFKEAGLSLELKTTTVETAIDTVRQDKSLLARQKIQFCKTSTGVNLAYAVVGEGPPLVKAANWLTHLELDWTAPIWSPLYRELAQDFTFIRYDERGNGLSDWNVDELSQDIFVKDLEYVVDNLGLEKFPLLGISQGAAVSIEYAIRHPERVSKLILFGGYAKGWRVDASPEIQAEREAMITLTKTGWGQNNPAYRHVFSSTFMPTASPEELAWFNDFQRQTTSSENAVKFLQAFADIDVRHHLPNLTVPTLVIHSRGDQRIDWQVGRDIAAEIPNAEFVTLDSENHLLLEGEPAADQFLSAVRNFLLIV